MKLASTTHNARAKLKGLASDTFLYGVGDALTKLSGLILLPLLTRVFTTAEYGYIDLLTVTFSFILIVLQLGIASGVQRQYYLGDETQRQLLVTSVIAYLYCLSLLVASVLYYFSHDISNLITSSHYNLSGSVQVLALLFPISILNNFQTIILRLQRRPIAFSAISLLTTVLTIVMTYIFIFILSFSIEGVFWGRLVALLIVVYFTYRIQKNAFCNATSFRQFYRAFSYSIPGLPGQIIKQIIQLAPRYLLLIFGGAALVGVYGVAVRIASPIHLYILSFNRAWNPFAYLHAGSPEESYIYSFTFKWFALSLITLALLLSFYAIEIVSFIAPDTYQGAAAVIPFIVFCEVAAGLTLILGTALYTNNRVGWTSVIQAFAILVFTVTFFSLYLIFDPLISVLFALIVSAYLSHGFALLLVRQVFLFATRSVTIIGITLCAFLSSIYLHNQSLWFPDILEKFIFILLFACLSAMLLWDRFLFSAQHILRRVRV